MNALELQGVCKRYPGFSLEDLNLTLPQGCIMGLVGENGAGKSTTIRLILDLIRRDGGSITLLGQDNREAGPLAREDVGVVLDEVGLSECLTPRQVGKVMALTFRNWDDERYTSLLKRLSLPEKKKFKDLSRGMKMKLGIAVALSHHPKLLILDEATSGLDPVVREEVLELFLDFTRDETHSVLISSHIVSDLDKICDYIAFLHQGKLLVCEEKDALKECFGLLQCDRTLLSELDPSAILGSRASPYGVEAIVRRDAVPAGFTLGAVDLEQLFIFMAKEDAK